VPRTQFFRSLYQLTPWHNKRTPIFGDERQRAAPAATF
jgi:hypothetical protein